MSYAEGVVNLLTADSALTTLLTGGIDNYSDLGRKGLERIQTSDAYNAQTGLLKPLCVVLETNEQADGQIVGAYTSFIIPVYTWIYDHGDRGYGTISAAFDLMYGILHLAQIPGAVQVLYKGVKRDKREPQLKDAGYYLATWNVYGYRTP